MASDVAARGQGTVPGGSSCFLWFTAGCVGPIPLIFDAERRLAISPSSPVQAGVGRIVGRGNPVSHKLEAPATGRLFDRARLLLVTWTTHPCPPRVLAAHRMWSCPPAETDLPSEGFFSSARAVSLVPSGRWTCERFLRWTPTCRHRRAAGWRFCPTCLPGTAGEAGKPRAAWLSAGRQAGGLVSRGHGVAPLPGWAARCSGAQCGSSVCRWSAPRSGAR